MPTIRGRVVEKWSGQPVVNALVNAGGYQVLTDGNGNFSVDVPSANVSLSAMHKDHETASAAMTLTAGTNEVIIELVPIARFMG